jgi:multisubunit Na+/H+ antiporter MnhB subunit
MAGGALAGAAAFRGGIVYRYLGTRFKPKFRNLGIVLVLIVVLVLGALAFCAGKDPHLSCNYFVPLPQL